MLIEHGNVINLINGLSKEIYSKYEEHLNVALIAPYIFDASVQQIFAALLMGHSLFIVPNDIRKNAIKLLEYYNKNLIHISDGTPVHINMISSVKDVNKKCNVKYFIIGAFLL